MNQTEVSESRSTKKTQLFAGCFILLLAATSVAWYVIDEAIANAQFQVSKGYVRAHTQSLIVYAGNNQDRLPSTDQWPKLLIEEGFIEQGLLAAPKSDGTDVSYFYVPGDQVYNHQGNQILIYENKDHWDDGVIVGLESGRVEFVSKDQFEQMLADQIAEEASHP